MHREIVDLVLRGHERGLKYGLPLSYLEHQCYERERTGRLARMFRSFEARVIGGQLMLRSWHRASIYLNKPLSEQFDSVRRIFCDHVGPDLEQTATAQIEKAKFGTASKQRKELIHCLRCATDCRIQVLEPFFDVAQVEITAWQQFGDRDMKPEIVQAMFRGFNFTQITPNEAATRNLEHTFNGAPAASSTPTREC